MDLQRDTPQMELIPNTKWITDLQYRNMNYNTSSSTVMSTPILLLSVRAKCTNIN